MPDYEGDREERSAGQRRSIAELGPGWISAIAGLIAALVAVVGLIVANSGDGSPDPSAETVAQRVLAPASSPPQVELCSEQLEFFANGTVEPVTCADGRLNELAWEHYAGTDRLVMSLGPNADQVQVGHALCSDLIISTHEEEKGAYEVAKVYNSWDFAVDPIVYFPENC